MLASFPIFISVTAKGIFIKGIRYHFEDLFAKFNNTSLKLILIASNL